MAKLMLLCVFVMLAVLPTQSTTDPDEEDSVVEWAPQSPSQTSSSSQTDAADSVTNPNPNPNPANLPSPPSTTTVANVAGNFLTPTSRFVVGLYRFLGENQTVSAIFLAFVFNCFLRSSPSTIPSSPSTPSLMDISDYQLLLLALSFFLVALLRAVLHHVISYGR